MAALSSLIETVTQMCTDCTHWHGLPLCNTVILTTHTSHKQNTFLHAYTATEHAQTQSGYLTNTVWACPIYCVLTLTLHYKNTAWLLKLFKRVTCETTSFCHYFTFRPVWGSWDVWCLYWAVKGTQRLVTCVDGGNYRPVGLHCTESGDKGN